MGSNEKLFIQRFWKCFFCSFLLLVACCFFFSVGVVCFICQFEDVIKLIKLEVKTRGINCELLVYPFVSFIHMRHHALNDDLWNYKLIMSTRVCDLSCGDIICGGIWIYRQSYLYKYMTPKITQYFVWICCSFMWSKNEQFTWTVEHLIWMTMSKG